MKASLALLAVAALFAQNRPTMFPPVRGTREMVAAANNFEVESGYRMLTQGGNAVDAGVASILTAAITEQARIGLGGEMPLLIKPAGKPVIAISNLQLLAAAADTVKESSPATGGRHRVFVATDARMEQAYWGVFEEQDGVWTQMSPPSLCDAGELPQMIDFWHPDWCAGNASWIRRHLGSGGPPVRDAAVQGAILARLAREKFARGETLSPERALPAYVRDRVALTVTERRAGAAGAQS